MERVNGINQAATRRNLTNNVGTPFCRRRVQMGGRTPMLNKILVPLDGSGLAERALTYATALATASGAELVLLRAATAHTLPGVDPRERQAGAIQEAESYLEQVANSIRERGFVCETVVPHGHPKECIVDQTRTRHADLIVMTTHGRTGPGRWIFGSVAESV